MRKINIHDFVVTREPLINIKEIENIPKQKSEILTFIKNLIHNKEFSESLFLATPELYDKWINIDNLKEKEKVINSVLKYFLRAISNTVPFGLFATYSHQSSNNIKYKRFSSIDLDYLYKVVNYCKNIPEVIASYPVSVNETLYSFGNDYRFIDRDRSNSNVSYKLASIEKNEVLEFIHEAKVRNFPFKDLVKLIERSFDDLTENEISEYLISLVKESFLLSEFDIQLNCAVSPLDQVLNLIKPFPTLSPITNSLLKIQNLIKEIDAAIFNDIKIYKKLFKLFDNIGIEYDKKFIINSNLSKFYSENKPVSKSDIKKIIEIMALLSPGIKQNYYLEDFKKRFQERFEDQEIPLLQVLDNDIGIGYKFYDGTERYSSLTDDININQLPDNVEEIKIEHRIKNFWTSLFFRFQDNYQIDLFNEDLSAFGEKAEVNMGSYNVSVNSYNDKLILKSVGGSSALNLISRFSNLDNSLDKINKMIVECEKHHFKSSILAEINHNPYYRGSNLLLRNIRRECSINILTPYKNDETYISLQDIVVKIVNNKIFLIDEKTRKEIIPFLTSAQNFHNNSTPLYQFLCDLQSQYRPNSNYINFGGLNLSDYPFIPRLTYKNIIISQATWHIKKSYLKDITNSSLLSFIKRYKMSRFVHLYEHGEDKMIFDVENENCLNIILQEIQKRGFVNLVESFYCKEKNETIKEHIYFISQPESDTGNSDIFTAELKTRATRSLSLGTDWIYLKIYCGLGVVDYILQQTYNNFIHGLLEKKYIKKWFFIRYRDSHNHIRLRLQVTELKFVFYVTEQLTTFFKNKFDYLIWKLEFSTYQRELERYGGNFIENAEMIFYADSESFIHSLKFYDNSFPKWYLTFLSIYHYFNDFKLDDEIKLRLISNMYEGFYTEFKRPLDLNKELNKKFEKHFLKIDDFIKSETVFTKIFCNRGTVISSLTNGLSQELKYDLINSFIHMSVNRFTEYNPRLNELILYGILQKFFKKEIGNKNYHK